MVPPDFRAAAPTLTGRWSFRAGLVASFGRVSRDRTAIAAVFLAERLRGDRRGQFSIRINDQYRVCFECREGNAHNVEITDYH